jgi:hypothetical protein
MQNITDANLGSAPFPDPNINVGLVQEATPSAITKGRISEDWVAVIISTIFIGLILGISKFTPGFSFKVHFINGPPPLTC